MAIKWLALQKILLWIPIFNAAVFIIWMFNFWNSRRYLGKKTFCLIGILTVLPAFIITDIEYTIFRMLVTDHGLVGFPFNLIITYIVGLTVGIIAFYSEKMLLKMYERENHNDT